MMDTAYKQSLCGWLRSMEERFPDPAGVRVFLETDRARQIASELPLTWRQVIETVFRATGEFSVERLPSLWIEREGPLREVSDWVWSHWMEAE